MSDIVARLRDGRNWLNRGNCCGDKDSAGICAAPACIFGEALKEFFEAADEIERLREALRAIAYAKPECCEITNAMQFIARAALEEK